VIAEHVILNDKQFNEALDLYLRLNKKTMAEAINEKMANIAYKSAQFTEPTTTKSVASAKIKQQLVSMPITKDGGVKRSGDTRFVGLYKLMNWQRKNSNLKPVGGKFGKNKATGFSKKFVNRRANSARWIRIGWVHAAKAFKTKPKEPTPNEKTKRQLGGGTPAVPASVVVAEIFNKAGIADTRYKPSRPRAKTGAVEVGKPGLVKGIKAEIQNMYKYIIPRLAKDWYGIKGKIKAV